MKWMRTQMNKHKIIALCCLITISLLLAVNSLTEKKEQSPTLKSISLFRGETTYLIAEGKHVITMTGTMKNDGNVKVPNIILNVNVGSSHYEFHMGNLEPGESRSFTQSITYHSSQMSKFPVDIYLTY